MAGLAATHLTDVLIDPSIDLQTASGCQYSSIGLVAWRVVRVHASQYMRTISMFSCDIARRVSPAGARCAIA